jgi:hypothetical protein
MFKKIVLPVAIVIVSGAIACGLLPENCSILPNNDRGALVNCLQDFPYPRLCCSDYRGVWISRSVFLVGLLAAFVIGWYYHRKENRASAQIFG